MLWIGLCPPPLSPTLPVSTSERFHAAPRFQPLLSSLGLDSCRGVLEHPDVVVWRDLPDRQNCFLDAALPDGRVTRLHIKRYYPAARGAALVDGDLGGLEALTRKRIPTVPLVAWGVARDGGSCVITEDLEGYFAADKLVEAGVPFAALWQPVIDLAARLHQAGLHHNDLYLCHFFVRMDPRNPRALRLRLIDTERVRDLPAIWGRDRWIVKDLAQFWYSTLRLSITDSERRACIDRYADQRGLRCPGPLRRAIERKVARIQRHDERLAVRQPGRNISLPGSTPQLEPAARAGELEAALPLSA